MMDKAGAAKVTYFGAAPPCTVAALFHPARGR
jgi:hypothetical protein